MSLDWNTSQVADKSVLTEPDPDRPGKELWSRTTMTVLGLLWYSGDFEITEKTIDALWDRADFTQRVFGGPVFVVPMMFGVAPVRLTRDDLVAHMGMTSNTFPRKTDTQFRKWVWESYLDSRASIIARDAEQAAQLAQLEVLVTELQERTRDI